MHLLLRATVDDMQRLLLSASRIVYERVAVMFDLFQLKYGQLLLVCL